MSYDQLWTGPIGDHRRYRVELEKGVPVAIAQGGEGLIYRGVREIEGVSHEIALKLQSNITFNEYEQFLARMSTLAGINHPGIMHYYESFIGTALVDIDDPRDEDFDVIYSASEWIPGETFANAVKLSGLSQGFLWVAQVARSVAYLHSLKTPLAPEGIVHRDIKPSNIRISESGEAILIDFGTARPHLGSDQTRGVGTYRWRAPEMTGGIGEPGKVSDVWSIGSLAYWILFEEPPAVESSAFTQMKIQERAQDLEFLDPKLLAQHLTSLLEIDPSLRHRDLTRWADRLEQLIDPNFLECHRRRRRRIITSTSGAAVVVLALLSLPLAIRDGSTSKLAAEVQPKPLNQVITCDGINSAVIGTGAKARETLSVKILGGTTPLLYPKKVIADPTGNFIIPLTCPAGTKDSKWKLSYHGIKGETTGSLTIIGTNSQSSNSGLQSTIVPIALTTKQSLLTGQTLYLETPGGAAQTIENYQTANGTPGPSLKIGETLAISCRIAGFQVQDSNVWWYRIVSPPWNGKFYVTADAFYNNGKTSGPLEGTRFYDPRVPICR
ncbi:serine/threonine protein kinase [Acidithrix ferrooxidans]|uniref:non-specific serine/threonine protein kinase n=1 Tax=Acidithrix ferrooxidans TaxID=1280514 RepID=A0A0D8HGF7_9ACTN|nr:protein kinase [Acidithrix ferrooxidans]KJF16837.1 serine/threonine-protein kinase PknA [Acidithrix ferrooxidans]